jgi:hypothetical protein
MKAYSAPLSDGRPFIRGTDAMKLIDLTGKRFGRWVVLSIHPKRTRSGGVFWACRCSCGTKRIVRGSHLWRSLTKSCGCLVKTHGMSRTRVHNIWKSMRQRCSNPNHVAYANYGGRGITVCERWQAFLNFYADMGDPPPGLSIDRINNDSGYESSNCKWPSRSEQCRNRRPFKRKRRRSTAAEIRAYAAALARAASPPASE